MIMRTIFEDALEQGKELCATFIDYSAAFDSVSHKFIDATLADAGASVKTRRMFRAIYGAANAVTKVNDTDGSVSYSDSFPIRRGVLQGDITSPVYFILALEALLRKHDSNPRKGVPFGGTTVHTLGYADDAALLDVSPEVATERVTAIAAGSKTDADMEISVSKTKVMHIRRQEECSPVTDLEAKAQAKFVCPHIDCNYVFNNKHGLKVHASKCKKKDHFTADKILEVFGATGSASRRFKVWWAGYGADEDTWEPFSNLPPHMIKEFLLSNNLYDHAWPGARCPLCDKPCKNSRGVKSHMRHCYFNNTGADQKKQQFSCSKAEAAARTAKRKNAQKSRPKVRCEGNDLDNVFLFKYLDSIYAVDDSHEHDVSFPQNSDHNEKMWRTPQRVFDSPDISTEMKITIYKSAVVSLLTYGCEAWSLTLNGVPSSSDQRCRVM